STADGRTYETGRGRKLSTPEFCILRNMIAAALPKESADTQALLRAQASLGDYNRTMRYDPDLMGH
ncbi:hypothetical protein COY95_02305, partial [Candidatus Woesearchaeota archaeon CG_4_10_14_0_8_um_filter_47_5]